jgi:RND family efflux transporter MFP subunit
MIKRIALYTTAVIALASCGGKEAGTGNKAAQLDKLKKEQAALGDKIQKLEAEIAAKNPTPVKAVPVQVMDVQLSTFRSFVEVQGRIDANESVLATSQAPGVVSAILVSTGQRVSKGQLLARLEDAVATQGIAELEQQISFAKSLFEKQKNLWNQQIGSEVQYLQAKNNYEALQKQKNTMLSQKAMYTIKAPVSGEVDLVDVRLGQMVNPGQNGIRIVNTSDLKAKANVGENYAARVSNGDEVQIIMPDLKDTFITKVSHVSKSIDPVSRAFSIEVKLPSNPKWRPNMVAIIKVVDYTNSKAMTVPVGAIQRTSQGPTVFTVAGGKAKITPVALGQNYDGKVEVLSGLSIDDKVVVTGYENLDAGDTVTF